VQERWQLIFERAERAEGQRQAPVGPDGHPVRIGVVSLGEAASCGGTTRSGRKTSSTASAS
jgi:hypothetical protein